MSQQLKVAKDTLVSSLYELSKAASEASAATVNFYNASLTTDEDSAEIFKELADSLRILTSAAQNVNGSAKAIAGSSLVDGILNGNANGTGAEVKIKKKIERDPNAPKKPLTVFFAYSAYVRQALREDRLTKGLPALSSTEITQEISKKWNELGENEKEKWKEAYNEELSNYHVLKEKYLEAKKNGENVEIIGPNPAPIAIPAYLLKEKSKKRSEDGERKEKKKKSKKRKTEIPSDASSSE